MTRTTATLEVSADTYNEVAKKLRDAGYGHVLGPDGAIDMQGIALVPAKDPPISFSLPDCVIKKCDQPHGGICKDTLRCHHLPVP